MSHNQKSHQSSETGHSLCDNGIIIQASGCLATDKGSNYRKVDKTLMFILLSIITTDSFRFTTI